jgi:hypothetical protein
LPWLASRARERVERNMDPGSNKILLSLYSFCWLQFLSHTQIVANAKKLKLKTAALVCVFVYPAVLD